MSYTFAEINKIYDDIMKEAHVPSMRELAKNDLFFLLTRIIGRTDINRPWLYERCLEVNAEPFGYIDLWARDHYKSTIITVGHTIQDILNDPEITCGIFSHTQVLARAFVSQIMRVFEQCEFLKTLFPEILYQDPKREATQWSKEGGIIVKRKNNPKECTVEGWGLVSGQPIGKHFNRMIYDDVVVRDSVTSADSILKTTEMWELSLAIASDNAKFKYAGTRYHANDTYQTMIERNAGKVRMHPATLDGTLEGEAVLLQPEVLKKKRDEMGVYTFSCQMLLNPLADKSMGFAREWIQYYEPREEFLNRMNKIIVVDPSSGRNKKTDYTVMQVWGLNDDKKYYLIYGIRDRLNLTSRASLLFDLVKEYDPMRVLYEEYGMQADIEFIQLQQKEKNFHFDIEKVGGRLSKSDRILAMVPFFEKKKIFLPIASTFRTQEGEYKNFTKLFVEEELLKFPVCKHDDMIDASARIFALEDIEFPNTENFDNNYNAHYGTHYDYETRYDDMYYDRYMNYNPRYLRR